MALIKSTSTLGTPAPAFDLPATDGRRYKLDDFEQDALLVMFICNHCPYVKAVQGRLVALAERFGDRCDVVAISSNDAVRYPEDSFDRMREVALEQHYPFPYLYDESQEVARAYGAVCTPDFFLYDAARVLVYRGRLDDDWQSAQNATSHDLAAAIEAVLRGEEPAAEQFPSMGCSIKWKY